MKREYNKVFIQFAYLFSLRLIKQMREKFLPFFSSIQITHFYSILSFLSLQNFSGLFISISFLFLPHKLCCQRPKEFAMQQVVVIVMTPTIVVCGNNTIPKFQIPGTTVFNMKPPSSAATQVNYKPFSHLTR